MYRGALHAAGGDATEARCIVLEDVSFELDGELAERMNQANIYRPCQFTSVIMCAGCEANEKSPARQLSSQYGKLAAELDPQLYRELSEAWKLTEQMAERYNTGKTSTG